MLPQSLILLVVASIITSISDAEQQVLTNKPATRPILKSNTTGGTGGDPFDDITSGNLLPTVAGVHSITVTYAAQTESIQVTYLMSNGSLYMAPRHGGNSSTNLPITIKLKSSEYVQKIDGKTDGTLVDQLYLTTIGLKDHSVKRYGPYGSGGERNFSYEGNIVGFHGRAGNLLNNIGVYILAPLKKSERFGGGTYYSRDFDENPNNFSPPVIKINKLFVHHKGSTYSGLIAGIQAEYLLLGGATKRGKKYGQERDTLTVIDLDKDEEITNVKGKGYNGQVCQLTFVSKKGDGSVVYYGPFGTNCAMEFSFDGKMMGFFGSVNPYDNGPILSISGFGIYYI